MAQAKTYEKKIKVNASSATTAKVSLGTNGKNAMRGYDACGPIHVKGC